MAQPTNTFSSYDAKGNREDLVNAIYSVDQTKTPFTSAIGKISATATLHEWQTDALAAAGANAVIEGDDAITDASIATVRLGNYTQISDKVPWLPVLSRLLIQQAVALTWRIKWPSGCKS